MIDYSKRFSNEEDDIARLLAIVADEFDREDQPTREMQVRYWKRLKYYWNNFSQIYWSDDVNDYRIFGRNDFNGQGTNDQAYYDKPVNVFKAFLETIIAALSIQVPAVSCIPDDADNPLDISTAKAGNIVSKQIYKHNNVILLWLQALYVYCTEGLIACYIYEDSSEEYGVIKEKKYKDEEVETYVCPNCKRELDEGILVEAKLYEQRMDDKFDPGDEDINYENMNDESIQPVCPDCATAIDSNLQKSKLVIPRFDGYTTKPKSRVCMEVYGGLYVKVANYAKKQCDTPYLGFSYETHYANALETYKDLRNKLPEGGWSNQGLNNPSEQYARLNIQYRGTYPENTVTVKNYWLRPASFNILHEDDCNKLKKKYPDGAKIVLVNDIVAHHCAEKLDDHWTLTQNPLSDYLSHEPLGEVLTNIQDIVNDLISLTLQTIEHGVAQTWADPAVVNFDQYKQLEVIPGAVTPTKTVGASKSIKDAFHSTTTASLSPEVFSFYRIIQELGQFVSGALPSLFGGTAAGTSNTASEYAMSKQMALQRLQTPWKMLTVWWKVIYGKAIPMYFKIMVDDERIVEKDEQGNFVNVFIRKAETQGKIGSVELEASEQLPISDDQQKEIIMQLIGLNNAEVFNALVAPENLPFVRKVVRIPEFKLPGEDDRQKQLDEIIELLNTVPIPVPQDERLILEARLAGQDIPPAIELPSVEIDPVIDNHQVEWDIVRSWAISEAGRLAKKENPEGYKNVLLHGMMHKEELDKRAAMMEMQANMVNENNGQTPKGQKQKGPGKIKDSKDVIQPVS